MPHRAKVAFDASPRSRFVGGGQGRDHAQPGRHLGQAVGPTYASELQARVQGIKLGTIRALALTFLGLRFAIVLAMLLALSHRRRKGRLAEL